MPLVDLGPVKKKEKELVDLGPAPTPIMQSIAAIEPAAELLEPTRTVSPKIDPDILGIAKRVVAGERAPEPAGRDVIIGKLPVEPKEIGVGRRLAQIPKGLVGGVEEMIGAGGAMAQWFAERAKIGKLATKHINIPGAGTVAEHLIRRFGPKQPLKFYDQQMGKYAKMGEKWADFWEEQANKGWEAPDPKIMEARWRDMPVTKAGAVISRAAPNYLAAIAASVLTKNPQVGLMFISGLSGAGAYRRQRKAGTPKELADKIALMTAAWEYVTEKVPFEAVFKPSKHLFRKMMKIGTMESAQEFVQGIGENFLEYFGYNAKDLKSVPAAVREGLKHAMDGWIENVVAGFGLGMIGAGAVGRGMPPTIAPEAPRLAPEPISPAKVAEIPPEPAILKPGLEKPKTAIEKGMVEQMTEMGQVQPPAVAPKAASRAKRYERVIEKLQTGKYKGGIQAADYANVGIRRFLDEKMASDLSLNEYALGKLVPIKITEQEGWDLPTEPTVEEFKAAIPRIEKYLDLKQKQFDANKKDDFEAAVKFEEQANKFLAQPPAVAKPEAKPKLVDLGPTKAPKVEKAKPKIEKRFYTSVPTEWRKVKTLYDWGKKGLRAEFQQPRRGRGISIDGRRRKTFIWENEFAKLPVGTDRKLLNAIKAKTDEIFEVKKREGKWWKLQYRLVPKNALAEAKEALAKIAKPKKPERPSGGLAWQTAVRQALETSTKKRRVVRVEQKKERGRRAGAYEGTVKWLMKKGIAPKEAIDKATAMLKGPLTEYQLYEGLDQYLPQKTIDNAYKDIATTDKLYPYERKSVKDAFEKLETGAVLTPGEVKLIRKWRPEFAKIAEKRVPLTVRLFSQIEQALGLLKFGAAFDVQMRRQARWLRTRHPALFTRVVGKNLGAYVSEKYANKLAKELENDPRHEDAVARGVKFLERKAVERPEQYISYWGEKIPLKIGKTYAASMRGFIDAFNWLQQQLWNYKVEHWEKQGVTITEEMLHDLADFNNTFLGMAQAKTNFGRATRRVLAPVMWSPTLTWSRVRTPSMILTNKTMRTETAVSLAGYIGSGMIFMLAASFLARALGKKDPIEWDPRATDFGKVRVGNTRIDVYGDGGPYIRALAQLTFQKKKNQAGRLRRRPRLEVLKQFVRNKRAPFFDFVGKVWSGRNYYGGPAWEIPDWAKIKEEDGLKQLVARTGEKITEPKAGRIAYLIARETLQKFAPFFVQSAVEASWHDGWPLGLAAGADEFFSGQALSYKPSTFAKLQMVQDISATAKYDNLWDDLSPSQQQQLRKIVPVISAFEELLAREKLPIERIDLREQNKVAERIRRSLPKDVREKLAPLGYRIIPGLSRRLGDFWLNDEKYAKYEKLASSQIEKRLRRLFIQRRWSSLDISQQEKDVRREINKAKEEARKELLGTKRRIRLVREQRMLRK